MKKPNDGTMINKNITISAIVAMAENRVIGKNNQLPWRLPADLRHFKAITTGHPVLMGRKTYESIGKPLPNRTNIIMTRNPSYQAPGCIVVTSIQGAIQSAISTKSLELFIIGGEEIYKQFLPYIQKMYLTLIHHTFEGDAFFPEINWEEWNETNHEDHPADNENPYSYRFITLEKVLL